MTPYDAISKIMSSIDLAKHTEYLCDYGQFGTPYFQCLHCSYWSYSHLHMKKHIRKHPWVKEENIIDFLLAWRHTQLQLIITELQLQVISIGCVFQLNDGLVYHHIEETRGMISFPRRHFLHGAIVYLSWNMIDDSKYEFDTWCAKLKDGTYFF